MKTIEELKKQEPVFLNDWNESFGVIADFEDVYLTKEEYDNQKKHDSDWYKEKRIKMDSALKRHDGENILFASYGCANYSGEAFVLFEKDGKLFEVNGSHCSCMGLEGQWDPEETTIESLKHRLEEGDFGKDDWSDNNFRNELISFLGL